MSHRGQIPSTTRSNPRYGSSANSSFYGGSANQSYNNKSHLGFSANQSFNGSLRENASILYPNRSKTIPSRNSWSHPFSIPIETGKRGNREELYSNVHVNKLRTGNNRRIVCGGLQWDIHIHPNQGENNNEFALSVFPVKNSINDKLPDNYKLKYTVTTSLNPRGSLQIGGSQNDDDQKSLSQFDHKWTREINDIVYDANPNDVAGAGPNGGNNQQINWSATMERLSFSTTDLYKYNCDEDDHFNLYVSIQTEFIKNYAKRQQYTGVLGAILLQSESQLEEQKKQIERLNNKQNEHILQLEEQLNQSNRATSKLIENEKHLTDLQRSTIETFDNLRKQLESQMNDTKQEIKYRDQSIESLRREIQFKNEEMNTLKIELTKLKTEIQNDNSLNSLMSLIQSGNALQQNNQNQILQQQQRLQQRYDNQNSQLLGNQNNMGQQHQPSQHQPMSNPFMPNINQSNMHQQQGGAKLSGVPSNNNQPQTHPQSQAYGNFPTGSPSQNVNTQRGSGGTLVISPSSQTTASNQSPQQSYSARVISQPDLNSLQFQQLNITSPQKLQTQQLSQQPQSQTYSMTEQPVAAQSPQMPSNNNNNDPNYNFGALSMTQQNTVNTVVPNNLNIPNLEQPEQKQNQQYESKSQALNEPTSAMSQQAHLSQKHESETGTGSATVSDPEQLPAPIISDVVDDVNDEILFQHRPARAWRWDAVQEKYRGRGKGQMTIYYNKATGKAKIIFYDEKNEKTRLLQYIDGKDEATLYETESNSNNHPVDVKDDEVVWFAADYTMDAHDPMVGQWKIQFTDDSNAALQFMQNFNEFIQTDDNNDNNGNQEISTTAPIDDQDDNKSNDSTKPFQSDDKPFDSDKPFAFNIQNEKPKDSFTDNPVNFGGDNNNWSFKGFGDNKNDTNTNNNDASSNNASGSGTFGDINWSFDAKQPQQPSEQKIEDKPVDDSNDTSAIGGGGDTEEDNGSKYTFKPIVQLDEVDVASGHENEELIKEFDFIKLFRFGKDVTGVPGWKNRASQSKISFYKSKETGKIRMIAREQDTSKLRMNQNVPVPSSSNFKSPKDKMYQWSAYDTTIAAEEESEKAGFSLWLIKFQNVEIGQEFQTIFDQASNNNGSIGSPVKSFKQESNEQEAQQPATPQLTNNTEQETEPQNDNNEQVEEQQNETEANEDDKYKGWSQEDIMADKARLEKAKIDAEQAKLFGSGDNSNQATSWNMNASDWNNSSNNFGGSDAPNFTFSENQRGVDLVAEKELNRIQTDKNIQFGVTNDENNTNDTQEQGDNNTNNEQEEPSSLGASNFAFVNGDSGDKQENDEKTSPKNTDTTETGTELSSAWGNIGGGFSSFKATDDAPTWGNNNTDGGWGNFGDDANNNDFNFGALMSDKKTEDQNENNDDNKDNGTANNDNEPGGDASNNDGDDNGKEYTFKPLVQLDEVDVESGHEDEKLLNTFEVAKVYRWGKDVTGIAGWKNRASNTKIGFYQSKSSGRIRIVCREDITNKLRLNQWIDKSIAKIDRKAEKQIGWHGVDGTIAAEDESNGLCSFAAKFRDGETAQKFMELLQTSAENNEQLK